MHFRRTKKILSVTSIVGLFVFVESKSIMAGADAIWQGGSGYAWNTPSNWSTGLIPDGAGASVIFSDSDLSLNGKTISDTASRRLGKLTFTGTSALLTTYTVGASANTFTFDNGGNDAFIILDGNKSVTIANKIALNDALVVNIVATSSLTLASGLSGNATQFVKNGAGKIIFSGTGKTFAGDLIINGGTMETTLANATSATVVIGAVDSAKNYLNAGNITIGNVGTLLEIKSAGGTYKTQAGEINGSTLKAEFGAIFKFTEISSTNVFTLKLNSGTIDGGADANHGIFYLSGVDLVFNEKGLGGTSVINAPNLIFDTSANAAAMTVTLNGGTLSGFGLIRKIGSATLLNFIDSGTLGADVFQIDSGAVNFGTATLSFIGEGLKFTNTTAVTNLSSAPTIGATFGKANQMSVGGNHLSVANDATGVLKLGGFDQSFGNVALGSNAKLFVYMQPASVTPMNLSFGSITAGTNSTLSVLGWRGNPNSHINDGNAAVTDRVMVPSLYYANIWFRGFAKGAVLGEDDILRPADFLTTTWQGGAGTGKNWFDIANWSVDVPSNAGATAIFGSLAVTTISLGNNGPVVGHLVVNTVGKLTLSTGTLIFDSGIINTDSTINGTGIVDISNLALRNGLRISSATVSSGNLSGVGDVTVDSGKFILSGSNSSYTGAITVNENGSFILSGLNAALGSTANLLRINGGDVSSGSYGTVVTIRNKVEFNGDFTSTAVKFDYSGDVSWTGIRTIMENKGSVIFGENFNLTGTGALVTGGLASGTGVFEFLGNNNNFSGGLTVKPRSSYASGGAKVILRGDMVIGEIVQDKNYLGSGSVTAIASIDVNTNGYETLIKGNVALDTPVGTNVGAKLIFSGGGKVTMTSSATLARIGTKDEGMIIDGDLAINGAALIGKPNITVNPDAEKTTTITSDQPSGILGIGSFIKDLGGRTIIDTSLQAASFTIKGGILSLNKNGTILDTAGTRPGLTIASGTLESTGGIAGTPVTNAFGALTITGSASIYLNDHSAIVFNSGIWTTGKGYSLTLQNSTGIWSTDALPSLSDTYVYFTSTSGLSAARLAEVAFTGYEAGAALVKKNLNGTDYWFLAPTGDRLIEWRGAGDTGIDTDRLWSRNTNWVSNIAPSGVGVVAAVRDLDGLLASNSIKVDMAVTLGKLRIESNAAQQFTVSSLNGGAITFDNNGLGATLSITGDNIVEISAGIILQSDDTLSLEHKSKHVLTMSGKISGNGGIVSNYAGLGTDALPDIGVIRFAGDSAHSDYSGGFWIKGATPGQAGTNRGARKIVIAADGSVFGVGTVGVDAASSIQSLHIGDGDTGYYQLLAEGGARVVDGTIRFDGNLYLAGGDITFQSSAWSYITAGMKNIYGNGKFILRTPLDGPGGFDFSSSSSPTVYFYGNNTFSGGVTFSGNYPKTIGIGSDMALGTGVITIGTGATNPVTFIALDNASRSIGNKFIFTGLADSRFAITGDLTLSYNGHSQFAERAQFEVNANSLLTIGKNHVFEGVGGLKKIGSGTLRVFSANEYSGDTELSVGVYQSGNDLSFGSAGSIIFTGGSLASFDGARTISNKVVFNAVSIGLDGTAGLLRLDPSAANGSTSLAYSSVFNITGNVAFGQNLQLTDSGSLTKSGAGTLALENGHSTYTGGTTVNSGILRVNAIDGFTSGRIDSGRNVLGTGTINVTTVNGKNSLVEIIVGGSNTVHIGGNLSINGVNSTSISEIRVTNSEGVISDGNIKTYFDANQTIGGNAYGSFTAPGDIIKTGVGTTTSVSVGKLVTPHLVVESGTLYFSAANSTGNVGKFTLGNGTLATGGLNQTFRSDSTFNLAGAGVVDMGNSGIITFGSVGTWSSEGMLTVENWMGTLLVGGGASQFRFINDIRYFLTSEMLSRVMFDSNTITYAPGAVVVRNADGYYELLPAGTSSEWNHLGSGYNWGTGGNWTGGIQPNGAGSSATFANADSNLNGKTINVDASIVIGSLVFKNTTAANYTISGNSLTLQQNDSDANAVIFVNGSNTVNLASQLNLSNNLIVSHDGTGVLTISGLINGLGKSLVKDGAGTVVLGNSGNNFSGGLTILKGTVATAANSGGATGALGSGTVTFGGDGTLTFTANGAQTIGNTLVVNAGVVGAINTATQNNTTITGQITGDGAIVKNGDGTLTLLNGNTYAGGTYVNRGIVEIRNSSSLGAANVSFSNDTTLRVGANDLTYANSTTLGGTVNFEIGSGKTAVASAAFNGSGTLNKTAAGRLKLDGASGSNAISVAGGSIEVANAASLNGTMTINNGASAFGSGVYGGDIDVENGGSLYISTVNDGSAIGIMKVSGDVSMQSGSGIIFKLNSENSYSILDLGGGTLTANGATLHIDVAGYVGAWGDAYTIFENATGGDNCFFDGLELDNQSMSIDLGDRQYYLGTLGGGIALMALEPIPEPSTYGLICLVSIFSSVLVRRRRTMQPVEKQ